MVAWWSIGRIGTTKSRLCRSDASLGPWRRMDCLFARGDGLSGRCLVVRRWSSVSSCRIGCLHIGKPSPSFPPPATSFHTCHASFPHLPPCHSTPATRHSRTSRHVIPSLPHVIPHLPPCHSKPATRHSRTSCHVIPSQPRVIPAPPATSFQASHASFPHLLPRHSKPATSFPHLPPRHSREGGNLTEPAPSY